MAFCSKCGQKLENNEKFCGVCGTPVPQARESFEQQNWENYNNLYTENEPPVPPKKGKGIKKLIIALVALVTLAAVLLAGYMIFFKKPKFAVYIKNGDLYYSDGTDNSFKVANDPDDDAAFMTADGKYLIYIAEKDDDTILYIADITDEDSDPERIKKNVSSVMLTADSKYIVFISDSNLYYYDIADKETVKLKSDIEDYTISSEGSRITYTTDSGEDLINLYMEELGKDNQEKVGSSISAYKVNPKGDILYYEKKDKLYKREAGKEKVLVASDIEAFYAPDNNGNIYYTKESKNDDSKEDIYYYNGSDNKRICRNADDVSSIYNRGGNYLLYAYTDDNTILITNGNTKTLNNDIRFAGIDSDGEKLAYIKPENDEPYTGTLYVIDIKDDGFGKPEKIADDVYRRVDFNSSDEPVYFRNYDDEDYTGTLYCGDDLIENDVEEFIWIEDSKSVIYVTDQDEEHDTYTLNIYKSGKSTRVADDVANISIDAKGNIYYLTDYSKSSKEGTLYYFDGDESEKIDDDVSKLCQVCVPGSYFYESKIYRYY